VLPFLFCVVLRPLDLVLQGGRVGPDSELVAGGVGELEAAPTGEGKQTLADVATGALHGIQRCLEVA
jgi:hypothetical protein